MGPIRDVYKATMYVNDLLLVDLVEVPGGSVCISRGVIRAYIVFVICRVLQLIFRAARSGT